MTSSGIVSAKLKLARAREHATALDASVKEFRKKCPIEFQPEYRPNDPGSPDVLMRITVTQSHDVPDIWPLIIGDILTNLRASLDHAVFSHVREHRPRVEDKDIQFPIHDRRDQFENKTRYFSRPVYRVINDSQPYRMTPPSEHPLAVLRDLVNCDKHRTLIVGNYATMQINIDVDKNLFEVVKAEAFPNTVMDVGAVVAGIHLRLKRKVAKPELATFHSEVGYTEAIEIPNTGGRHHSMVSTMNNLCDDVEMLLKALEEAGV